MIHEPIYQGLLQSDLDCNGFSLLNFPGAVGTTGGGDITPLVNGQEWIEIVFDVVQSSALWVFTQLLIVNTVDAVPFNLMPGILTQKTTTGFVLQLSGSPDSANYELHWNFSGTGGGSGLSTSYTTTDTTAGGQPVRIIVPSHRVAHTAVVWCHGLGDSAIPGFDPTTAAFKLHMQGALAHGYLLAAGDYHGDQWDNATAQADIEALVALLVASYGVTDVVMWSGSAGGLLGLLKATQGFTGVTVHGWSGIFPVCDLAAAHATGSLTASINAAFPGYPTGTTGRDPLLFSASAYNGLRIQCCGSLADTVVPVNLHGDALVTLATGHATEAICTHTTGDHGDASNFTQAFADDFVAFLNRCF